MKKKILYLSILLSIATVSCNKELNQIPISNSTSDTFFASQADFTQAMNAVYNDLRAYPDRLLNLSETRSDNLYAVSDGGVRDWDPVNNFAKTLSNNPYITEAWAANFNGIYRANVMIEQLQKNGGVLAPALRTRFEAEAKFLRAFYYFDLVRWFGKVPLTDHTLTSPEASVLARTPVADVYKQIISDFQFGMTNLPVSYAAADVGRATKYAAEGMLALVYMTRSGPTYSIEGPGLNVSEWSLALPLLNDIIGSGKYSFISSYANVFSYTNENNSEDVFDVQYTTGLTPVVGGTFPWLLVPDTYFTSLGKPVQGGLFIRPVSNDLLNSFAATDTRKAFSIFTSGYVNNGVSENRPFFKKYLDITKVPTNRLDWPINFMVLRYTDILMMKAECILHGATGTQADVDAIVNQVRARGALLPVAGVTLAQLFAERRKEFAGEGSRWHDLVRSGLVTTVMPAWIAVDDAQKQIQPFQNNYVIYPVPQGELDAKPGLYTQNPGY